MLEELIRNPIYAILAVLILWQILRILLVKYSKEEEKTWVRMEYTWVIAGFMGVITLVIENDDKFKRNELEFQSKFVRNQVDNLLKFAEMESNCRKFSKGDWIPTDEFLKIQAETDSICNWIKSEIIPLLKESIKNDYDTLKVYRKINLHYLEGTYTPGRIENDIKRINKEISVRDNLKNSIYGDVWLFIRNTFGVILLIIAFAIRLTIISKKLSDLKK